MYQSKPLFHTSQLAFLSHIALIHTLCPAFHPPKAIICQQKRFIDQLFAFFPYYFQIIDQLFAFVPYYSQIIDQLFAFVPYYSQIIDQLFAFVPYYSQIIDQLFAFVPYYFQIIGQLFAFIGTLLLFRSERALITTKKL